MRKSHWIVLFLLPLLGCGEEEENFTAADEKQAIEIAMKNCTSLAPKPICECIANGMKENLDAGDYEKWVTLTVASNGARTIEQLEEKTGLPHEELIKISADLSGKGAVVGIQCEKELSQ